MDDLVSHEKSRYILLRDDLTVKKIGCKFHERRTKDYLMIWGLFWSFSGSKGPPTAHSRVPRVPNEQPSVPWEVETQNCTVGWFNYGKLGVSPMEGVQRNIWWFKACFGHFLTQRAPPQPPRVPDSPKWTTQCFMRSRDIKFYSGKTVGKLGVSYMEGRQRNIWFEACFGRFLARRGPQRPPPRVPDGHIWTT